MDGVNVDNIQGSNMIGANINLNTNPQTPNEGEQKPETKEEGLKQGDDLNGGNPPVNNNSAETQPAQEISLFKSTNGDIVNEKGKVLIPKDQVKLDDKGGLILPDDFKYDATSPSEFGVDSIVNVAKGLEFDFTGEDNKPIVFENTEEGIKQFLTSVKEQAAAKAEEALFTAYPKVQRYLEHIAAGGTDENFFNIPTKFRNTSIPEMNDKNKVAVQAQCRELIVQNQLRLSGGYDSSITQERYNALKAKAEKYADVIISTGEEANEAKEALAELQEFEKGLEDKRNLDNQEKLKQNQQKIAEHVNNVRNIVKSKSINGVPLQENEAKDFEKFLFEQDKDGLTGEQRAMKDATLDQRLLVALLYKEKFDMNKVLDVLVKQREAQKIKQTFVLKGDFNEEKAGTPVEKSTKVDWNKISVSNMLGGNKKQQ